jgi:putative DNA primase/helicase
LTVVRDEPEEVGEVDGATAKKAEPKNASGAIEWVDLGDKGAVLHTAANLAALMDWMGYEPRRNLMSHESDWTNAPRDIARECLQGAMASVILDEAQRHGWSLPEAAFWRCLGAVEARRSFHPVEDWVRAKPWDGKGRFEALFRSLTIRTGFEEYEALMRVQLEKWLVAGGHCLGLRRNAAEGIAVQGVLVLQGRQDLGKTRWFRSLVPDPSWIAEGVTLDPSNTDSVIAATSAFLVELGELDATTKKSDVAQLKSFLTRSVDKYRAAYGRKAESYPRRTLFGATVNPDEFLVDQTGNRRFWVMPLEAVNAHHGIDMQQVWAEALARAEGGEPYWMPEEHKDAQLRLAAAYQTRSEWADDFWHHFRLPDEFDAGSRYRSSEVREVMYPDRRWSQSEMRSFGLFLKSTGAKTDMGRNVLHIRLVRR